MVKESKVEDYISKLPAKTQVVVKELRKKIRTLLPDAQETISYGIPAFRIKDKTVVYFAGWEHHVSVYPVPHGDTTYQKQITLYKAGKGTLKFSLDKSIPHDIIEKTVKLLVKERFLD